MLTSPASGSRRADGFSLIELMVTMVAGMILIGSVLGLVVANLRNNAAVASGIRLSQESRALTEVMSRELRRVRYNGQALAQIGSGATATTFETLDSATPGCIKFAYDADSDGVGDNGEFRVFSRTVESGRGVFRYGRFATAVAMSCTTGQIISSDDIDITALTFVDVGSSITFSLGMSTVADADGSTPAATRHATGAVMIRSGDPVMAFR